MIERFRKAEMYGGAKALRYRIMLDQALRVAMCRI